jgi:hypothetical protein
MLLARLHQMQLKSKNRLGCMTQNDLYV